MDFRDVVRFIQHRKYVALEKKMTSSVDTVKLAASDPPMVQLIDSSWHALLEPCRREEADKATVIRRTLKRKIGGWQTGMVLSSYRETCLRIGPCGRYIVNEEGQPMRLVRESSQDLTREGAEYEGFLGAPLSGETGGSK